MIDNLGEEYLTDVISRLSENKRLADRALAQMDDDAFFGILDPESNSAAILVKHVAGNMRSRWRNFLISDGEKPDRNRDEEFIIRVDDSRASLMKQWEAGWEFLFSALKPLTEPDLLRTVTIRKQPLTVVSAINRQLSHYAYHIGQLVLLAKHSQSSAWETLSIPRGGSTAYNSKQS